MSYSCFVGTMRLHQPRGGVEITSSILYVSASSSVDGRGAAPSCHESPLRDSAQAVGVRPRLGTHTASGRVGCQLTVSRRGLFWLK